MARTREHCVVASFIVFWGIVMLELEVDLDVVAGCTTRLKSDVSKTGSTGKYFDLVSFCSEIIAKSLEEGDRVGDVDDVARNAGIVEVVRVR